MKELNNVDMSQYTSFRAGGKVRRFIIVENAEELGEALGRLALESDKEKIILLGNGSNTLFVSPLFDGTVIKLGDGFDYIEIEKDDDNASESRSVKVGAATLLSRLSKAVGSEGLTGLEFASGIPGSVGGAVFMNAGAYEGEIKDTLKSVTVLARKEADAVSSKNEEADAASSENKASEAAQGFEVKTYPVEDLNMSYRHTLLMETGDIVLEAEFCLPKGNKEEINAKMKDFTERRTSKQPLEYPSAGSFFKRPVGHFAGKLIEDAGLKGFSVGGAQVSEKHAGFLINKGNATPEDIMELMESVQKKVKEDFGVDLEPEVRIIR